MPDRCVMSDSFEACSSLGFGGVVINYWWKGCTTQGGLLDFPLCCATQEGLLDFSLCCSWHGGGLDFALSFWLAIRSRFRALALDFWTVLWLLCHLEMWPIDREAGHFSHTVDVAARHRSMEVFMRGDRLHQLLIGSMDSSNMTATWDICIKLDPKDRRWQMVACRSWCCLNYQANR